MCGFLCNSELLFVLIDVSHLVLWVDDVVRIIPYIKTLAALLEQRHEILVYRRPLYLHLGMHHEAPELFVLAILLRLKRAYDFSQTDVFAGFSRPKPLFLFFELGRHDPIISRRELTICLEFTDLDEVEATKFILHKIAHEVV